MNTNETTLDATAINSEQNLAANEIHQAVAETNHLISEINESKIAPRAIRAITEDEQKKARDRAQTERSLGRRRLADRQPGIAGILLNVHLNERVVASAFERYYPTMAYNLQIIEKHGRTTIGQAGMKTVLERIDSSITDLESEIEAQLAGVKTQMDIHENDFFIKPTYTQPAASHEVQIVSKFAKRIVDIFIKQDQILMGLQALNWNSAIEEGEISKNEGDFKNSIRKLLAVYSRILRGIQNKVSVEVLVAENDQKIDDRVAA